ncbi:MAG: RdgB/HAM1 family non-canonical purine NTP pyrophosphatase [Lachnospiraceae bacterium]|nr:RdgB/HAM1 family non-canonical purine NTP pyrophosphatase [Lachnospiraceae bacterium]
MVEKKLTDKLIFASNNEGKIREVKEIMQDYGKEILSLREAGIDIDIEENGTTFEENALIKCRVIHEITGAMVLADDSGLEIDYLNKEPGVYSARYLGHDTPYDKKNQIILDRVKAAQGQERSTRYVCAIAAVLPDGSEYTVLETVEGLIAEKPAGEGGFGYDPIFLVPEYGKTMAELTPEEKNAISHRGKALRAIRSLLEQVGK